MSTYPTLHRILRPRRVLGAVAALAGAGGLVAIAASCLSDIKDTLPPGIDAPPVKLVEREGGVLCTPEIGAAGNSCCPASPSCYPPANADNPDASGSECLATRDNTGQSHWQFRTVWGWTPKPDLGATASTDGFIFPKNQLFQPDCNMPNGTSGYIQLTDLDRSDPDPTKHVGKVGYAAYIDKMKVPDALKDGLCMLEFDYTDPKYGKDDPVNSVIHVKPSSAHRVMTDFTVDDAFHAAHKDMEDGVFFLDETTGKIHSFASKAYVALWEGPTDIDIITVHENEVRGLMNDPAHPNCVGRYRGEALDPNAQCAQGQANAFKPAFGCFNETPTMDPDAGVAPVINGDISLSCSPGGGQSWTKGYFLIEELDYVYLSILQQSLLVNYYGQTKAMADGWIPNATSSFHDNAMWKSGARPKGDWCSTTNKPADDKCADAFLSIAIQDQAAVNVSATACPAPAAGYL